MSKKDHKKPKQLVLPLESKVPKAATIKTDARLPEFKAGQMQELFHKN